MAYTLNGKTACRYCGREGRVSALIPGIVWTYNRIDPKDMVVLQLTDPSMLPSLSEEDYEQLVALLASVLGTIDAYLKLRGTEGLILRRIRHQRCVISDAIESIKRGYAPGGLPSEQERLAAANVHLRQAHRQG